MKHVAVFRIPHIKQYVFNTDRLVEIRGASSLLDQLNRCKAKEQLEKCFGPPKCHCVFVGGGIGQFIIDAPQEEIEAAMTELAELFSKETAGGISLLYGISPLQEQNYHQSLRNATYQMETKNDEQVIQPSTPIHTGLVRECMSCSGMAASLQTHHEETLILCDVCLKKFQYGKENANQNLWKEFAQFLKNRDIDVEPPVHFGAIGDQCKGRKGYTALVYADGNGMGNIVDQIQTPRQFEFFSSTVDNAIREACHEALHQVYFSGSQAHYREMPAIVLMLGGDDLMVYLTADKAFSFALEAAERFTQKTREEFQQYNRREQHPFPVPMAAEKGLTLSLGIAYGKSQTPISILLSQAEELLRGAKRGGSRDPGAGDGYAPSYIDYHLSTTFNTISVEDCRKNHQQTVIRTGDERKTIKLYSKPYSLQGAKKLYGRAKGLVEAGIPTTRLRRLGYAPFLAMENGSLHKSSLECINIFTRTPKDKRGAIREALEEFHCFDPMPWNVSADKTSTVLVDLLELADFYYEERR